MVSPKVSQEAGEWVDWTVDPVTKRSNTSPRFEELVSEVERLIKDEARSLIGGNVSSVARLIMAQLAHVHHLSPP